MNAPEFFLFQKTKSPAAASFPLFRQALCLICASCLLAGSLFAESPVSLTIDTESAGAVIPEDFIGLSFETDALQRDSRGVNGYLFDSANTQLLALFRNLGIRNLRIGGTSVDTNEQQYIPAKEDIDALFRFAKNADTKVIYSLRLLNGDPSQDVDAARYVLDHYRSQLNSFAIGNEPNLYKNKDPEITNDVSFYEKWRRFANAITNSLPEARFGGPDTGTGGTDWAAYFAKREAGGGIVTCIFPHYYAGGFPKNPTPQKLVDGMLSPGWDASKYPGYYEKIGAVSLSLGFPYRLTELNCYVASFPGVAGGNNSFATALFALDCMHWWAEHHCHGVNFHTVLGKYNGTVYRDANGDYQVYSIGYGIKAFDLGGHGKVAAVSITNPDQLNLTAYAVSGTSKDLFVTVVNKEHDKDARDAVVTINTGKFSTGAAEAIFLTAPNRDVYAIDGITLGDAPVPNKGGWQGKWTSLKPGPTSCVVTVPATSAAIIRISARQDP